VTANLTNIKQFASAADDYTIDRFFTDENGHTPTDEHLDQILVFRDNDASRFIWNYEHQVTGFTVTPKFFKSISTFLWNNADISRVKKNLYNLKIPFSSWVFIAEQPQLGFMLTWKMVIKYCSGLFSDDYQQVWDKTLNWKLEFNHGQFLFGKDLVVSYDQNINYLEQNPD
jgi:hypothetical protein